LNTPSRSVSTLTVNKFTEETLETEGWYFFYPDEELNKGRSRLHMVKEGFVYIEQDAINGSYLKCPKYQGFYIGPIDPPKLEDFP